MEIAAQLYTLHSYVCTYYKYSRYTYVLCILFSERVLKEKKPSDPELDLDGMYGCYQLIMICINFLTSS